MSAVCPAGHVSTTSDYCDQCGARIDGAEQAAAPPGSAPASAGGPIGGAPAGLAAGSPPGEVPGQAQPGVPAGDGAPSSPAVAAAPIAGAAVSGSPSAGPAVARAPVPGAAGAPGWGGAPVGETTAPYVVIPPAGSTLCPVCATARSGDDRFCEGCGYDFDAPPPAAGQTPWEAVATADRDYFERVAPAGVLFPPHCPSRTFVVTEAETRIGRRSGTRGIDPEIDLSGAPEDTAISHLHALLLRQADGTYALVDPGSTNGTTVNDDPTPVRPNVAVPLADGDRIHLGAWTTLTLHARP